MKRIVKPMYDYVAVRRAEPEPNACGLYVPEGAQPNEAIVVAVGDGRVGPDGYLWPLLVKPGDRVLLNRWAADEVGVGPGSERLGILREAEILAILREDPGEKEGR